MTTINIYVYVQAQIESKNTEYTNYLYCNYTVVDTVMDVCTDIYVCVWVINVCLKKKLWHRAKYLILT